MFFTGRGASISTALGKEKAPPPRVCVCLSVTQASKYSTMVKASKWRGGGADWTRDEEGTWMQEALLHLHCVP